MIPPPFPSSVAADVRMRFLSVAADVRMRFLSVAADVRRRSMPSGTPHSATSR
jgi:hypothetical protein